MPLSTGGHIGVGSPNIDYSTTQGAVELVDGNAVTIEGASNVIA